MLLKSIIYKLGYSRNKNFCINNLTLYYEELDII